MTLRDDLLQGTHRQRIAKVRAVARTDSAAIAELAQADVFGRRLSGVAAFEDRDGQRILALAQDPSSRVRGIAATLAPLVCDDPQAADALRVAWSVRRERGLLRRMCAHRRTGPVDAFLDWLAENHHWRELVDDLPFGSEAAVRRHLPAGLERPSRRMWDGLAGHHPTVLAEILVERWEASYGEEDPVTRQLTEAHHPVLAQRVPALALRLAAAQLDLGIQPAPRVWTLLLRALPREALELAIRHDAPLPERALASRVDALPAEVLARAVVEAPRVLGPLGPWYRRLTADRRAALAQAWLGSRSSPKFQPALGTWLLAELPADAARDEAYAAWSLASRAADGVIPADQVRPLPRELAAIEARRHLSEVVALGTDPFRRITGYARYLPWDEAETALQTWLGHPDGSMRGLALGERLRCPGIQADDPTLPGKALALVTARKFEQDPVRTVMFTALAEWPQRIWRPEHLEPVGAALRDALDASDCSWATAAAAERLVVRLFPLDPGWAATWLGTLVKERGTVHDPRLGSRLSEADVRAAAPHLLRVAESWATNERIPWLAMFAGSLGPRLTLVEGLPELVARARDTVPWESYAQSLTQVLALYAPEVHQRTLGAAVSRMMIQGWYGALCVLADQDGLRANQRARRRSARRTQLNPILEGALQQIARLLSTLHSPRALNLLRKRAWPAFDRLVPELLRKDPSVVCLPDVYGWLHRHRQDLLDPFLVDKPVTGTWATGNTRWILPYRDGFFRWTPPQVEWFADALQAVVGDRDRDTPAVLSALTVWPQMEYADQQRLIDRVGDERPAVAEKAVRVLARCDAGQGVSALLACLETPRARFAIYGLRRALFAMIPERALELLRTVPMRKVTIAKETLRLLGELRTPGGYDRLVELANGSLHRDVRIALLRAMWDHLDREQTWVVYADAVQDPDWVVASRLGDIPADRLTVASDRRLSALLAVVVSRPEPEARIELLRRAASLAVVDPDHAFLAACRARLRSVLDDEVRAAVAAVLARSTEADVDPLRPVLAALDPRMLHVAGAALLAHPIGSRETWKRMARALHDAAAGDPRWSGLAIRAGAAFLTGTALCERIEQLPLDPDALVAAYVAVQAVKLEEREPVVALLLASRRPEVRRIAVAALEGLAGPGRGWTEQRLAWLRTLRADPDPAVAGAAARVWPPREQDPGFTHTS